MEELKKLIDLKSILTLTLTIGLTVGFFMNKIEAKDYFMIVTMVFTYYFSRKDKQEPVTETEEGRG